MFYIYDILPFVVVLLISRDHYAHGDATSPSNLPIPPQFFSRPDLDAPTLDVLLLDQEVSPGLIFVSPYFNAAGHTPDPGPYIFDSLGGLVWSGVDDSISAGISDVHGLHVCHYQAEDHLCFWKGRQKGHIYGSGVGIIMDNHYRIVRVVQAFDSFVTIDLHEFQLTPQGTALVTGYRPRLHGSLWIRDSVFREIAIEDGEVLFEWSALDHVSTTESRTPPGSFSGVGTGIRNYRAWDFFHINSVDKDESGDYLISSRHTDAVLKVSRVDGSVLWRLGGDHSTFKLDNFTFRRQHHVRVHRETRDRTILSLFDNDNDGFIAQGEVSKGIMIELDHSLNTASVLQQWGPPIADMSASDGMGSLSVLPDNSTFISWGADSAMTEYGSDGNPIFHARIGWESRNYRAFKSPWIGRPMSLPSLWTVTGSNQSAALSYVSWNGATEVRLWRFYGSWRQEGPYDKIGEISKTSFETALSHALVWPWIFAEALDHQYQSLGNSTASNTYLSSAADMTRNEACGRLSCESSNRTYSIRPPIFVSGYRWDSASIVDYFIVRPQWRIHVLMAMSILLSISLWRAWRTRYFFLFREGDERCSLE